MITIQIASADATLLITIKDNGQGMTNEELDALRKNLATVGVEIFVHLKGVIYAVPKAELLYGEIRFDIFELFGQCG